MPPIISAQGLSKRYSVVPLFHNVSFTISEGDRIGVIGPNGSGKSTLLDILSGITLPDTGDVAIRKGTHLNLVRQISEFAPGDTVRSVINNTLDQQSVPESERLQRTAEILGRAAFTDLDIAAATLSGGWRKRLAIAEALVRKPDILLLDEPTNHLDLAGIEWLESVLLNASFACVVVSHDRYFLENVSNEVVELNPAYEDGSLRVSGNYSAFLEAKELYLPCFKEPVIGNLGILTLIFFALVIIGSSNAVNLTDGLDGLATGCTITAASTFAILCYAAGNVAVASYLDLPYFSQSSELTVLCTALVGAGLGFLWFNCHPARVFMGDTGSLSIGSTLGVIAICCKQEILLALVGGIFVIEAVSVILQVASFKLRGKRVLLMAPLHHHFELKGWKENTVIVRFWIMSLIFAFLGLATLKLR